MRIKQIIRSLVILIILGSNIGCDQISKSLVRQQLDYDEQISLINDHLTLTKVENTGAFLSVGQSLPQPFKIFMLVILPVAFLGAGVIFLLVKKGLSNPTVTGVCFIIGGGIGNIYDRLVYGSVTDFLHIDFVVFQTGIFNMADVSIMTGMIVVIFDLFASQNRVQSR